MDEANTRRRSSTSAAWTGWRESIRTLLIGVLLVSSTLSVAAQGVRFGTTVDMVALTVSVTGAEGRAVSGLVADNFAVFEDGVQQPLALFGGDEIPVDVALLMDTSGSMIDALPTIKAAARGLVARLRAGDRATVIDVKRSIRVTEQFTHDRRRVAAALDTLAATGDTAIYDGVYVALHEFERRRRDHPEIRRQALVLLSDGLDTASHVTFDDITELARTLDVTIYTISVRTAVAPVTIAAQELHRATWEMRALARETGGLPFFPATPQALERCYEAIARELANQYALGFVMTAPPREGAFRRIAIRVLPPAHGSARTRTGYIAK